LRSSPSFLNIRILVFFYIDSTFSTLTLVIQLIQTIMQFNSSIGTNDNVIGVEYKEHDNIYTVYTNNINT